MNRKRRKVECEDRSSDEGSEGEAGSSISQPKHRVTAKGSNVPHSAETFEELADRYKVAPGLLTNLDEHGYKHPTGVQAHGIPILLEVSECPISPLVRGAKWSLSSIETSPQSRPPVLERLCRICSRSCPVCRLRQGVPRVLARAFVLSFFPLLGNWHIRSTMNV